VKMERKKRTIY